MTICENLGNYLNQHRLSKGKSITKLSEELGISRSSLQSILKGTANPRSDTLEQIAAKLHVELAALLNSPTDTAVLRLTEQQKQDLILLLERHDDSREERHE